MSASLSVEDNNDVDVVFSGTRRCSRFTAADDAQFATLVWTGFFLWTLFTCSLSDNLAQTLFGQMAN